jgi:hypothetical protein
MECQRDINNLTLNQYRYGSLLEACAVEAGLVPIPMATLNTDVLGRLVFSAIGQRDQAAGQSDEDRAQFIAMTIKMLDRTGDVAKHGNVLFDSNLSNSQKASKFSSSLVSEFGGVAPFSLAIASLGGNAVQGVKQLFDSRAKAKAAEDLKKIKDIVRKNSLDIANEAKSDAAVVGLVAQKYEKIKATQDALVSFFQTPSNDKPEKNDLERAKANVIKLAGVFNKVGNRTYTEAVTGLDTSLLFWLSNTFETLNGMVIPSDQQEPLELGRLVTREQNIDARIDSIVRSITTACAPKEKPGEPQKPQDELNDVLRALDTPNIAPEAAKKLQTQIRTDLKNQCVEFMNVFRRDAVALRFVFQQLLKSPPA